jgi:hypothetical protein
MSLAAICWWTLARTVVLCLLAWPVCRIIETSLNRVSQRWRPWLLAGLLAPCCFPELLVGYAFRDLALANPSWAEMLCSGLLLVRMIPVGTVALLAAPRSDLDATSLYCRHLLRHSGSRWWRHAVEVARCYWHGPVVRALPALALMGIVAFQEFELAALLQTMSWSDWFVAAERVGLERHEMLRQSLLPLLWQTPLLLGVLMWIRAGSNRQGDSDSVSGTEPTESRTGRRIVWLGVSCVGVSLIAGCLIPAGLTGREAVDGFRLLSHQRLQQLGLAREIATAGAVAVCAGFLAWIISGRLKGFAAGLFLPGLFGSLLLSLGCVALFQFSWLHPLYDTPVPWVLALVVWLLPRAAILRLWLHSLQNNAAIHLAELVESAGRNDTQRRSVSSSLLWRLRDQPRFLAVCLLCYWAYCDLPSAYLLAPTGMASGLVRLYNFMHFGRSAALSGEASLFFGAPFLFLSLVVLSQRRLRARR